ncbi:MAG: hypothetical protein AAF135_24210 [Bacteroidota bacterium]
MYVRPKVWIIDTSILTNIYKIPGKCQDHEQIMEVFGQRIENGDRFFLPYPAIVETGNFIEQLKGDIKYKKAQQFVEETKKALQGDLPWKPLNFPEEASLLTWLEDFPHFASHGIGFTDFSIIKEREQQQKLLSSYDVQVWSLDSDLTHNDSP